MLVVLLCMPAFLEPPPIPGARAAVASVRTLRARDALCQVSEDYDAKTYDPEKSGFAVNGVIELGREEGMHGTGYRFMPMMSVSRDPAPAIICLAGAYPGLRAEQFDRPRPLPFAPAGAWNYHVLTNDAAPGGFVAVPGSDLLNAHPDTIGVVCASASIGIEFPDGVGRDVLALITRQDAAVADPAAFDPQSFYALADPEGVVHIRWMEALPAGWRVLGAVLYTQMPFVKRKGEGGGFAEMSDDFDF